MSIGESNPCAGLTTPEDRRCHQETCTDQEADCAADYSRGFFEGQSVDHTVCDSCCEGQVPQKGKPQRQEDQTELTS